MPFAPISMTNTSLPQSFLAVTGDAFCYSGHAYALHQRQVCTAHKMPFAAIVKANTALP